MKNLNNAYDILGVSPRDSEEKIKKAYRKKAHAIESSFLSEYEKERQMSELDSAFDIVFNEKRGVAGESSSYSQYDTQFPDVRRQIDQGRLDDASTILDGIPANMRSAEWYYLKGVIHRNRGWLNEAYSCFATAVSMDSGNSEYRSAFESMKRNANGGYRVKNNRDDAADGCCDCCDCCDCGGGGCLSDLCTLWCCDNICECFGGDLCGCC